LGRQEKRFAGQNRHEREEDMKRRTFLQGVAAGSATLGLGMPAIAQGVRVKIGYVRPETGPLAGFAGSDDFVLGDFAEIAKSMGLDIEIITKDSQSNPSRAGEVANELIVQDEVNLIIVGAAPETNNPVATICESEGIPCISTLAPWQSYFIARQPNPADPASWKPFQYGYHFFWGLEDVVGVFTKMWQALDTNKKVGFLFANDADGNAWADPQNGLPPVMNQLGYDIVDLGRHKVLNDDFTNFINAFKEQDVQIVTGTMIPPDFITFWNQAQQAGYRPKMATVGKGLLYPQDVAAVGPSAHNLSCEVWWSPAFPFKSSLNGLSTADYAAKFEAATGRPWTQVMGFIHALLEVAVDAIKRADDPTDPDALAAAVAATNLDTIVGKVGWPGGTAPPFAAQNICRTPVVGGQWRVQEDGSVKLVIVENTDAPDVPQEGTIEPLI
jgi:branched-chain amino acid transport system substrate-binding protein